MKTSNVKKIVPNKTDGSCLANSSYITVYDTIARQFGIMMHTTTLGSNSGTVGQKATIST